MTNKTETARRTGNAALAAADRADRLRGAARDAAYTAARWPTARNRTRADAAAALRNCAETAADAAYQRARRASRAAYRAEAKKAPVSK